MLPTQRRVRIETSTNRKDLVKPSYSIVGKGLISCHSSQGRLLSLIKGGLVFLFKQVWLTEHIIQ